jgi:hypothetical protein
VLASLARVELTLGALLRCHVIVELLDRLIGLSEALGVMAPDRFGNVMQAIRPKEEVPAENVPPEQIRHLGLAAGGRRAGRGHCLKPRSRPPVPDTHAALPHRPRSDRNHRTDSRLAPWLSAGDLDCSTSVVHSHSYSPAMNFAFPLRVPGGTARFAPERCRKGR